MNSEYYVVRKGPPRTPVYHSGPWGSSEVRRGTRDVPAFYVSRPSSSEVEGSIPYTPQPPPMYRPTVRYVVAEDPAYSHEEYGHRHPPPQEVRYVYKKHHVPKGHVVYTNRPSSTKVPIPVVEQHPEEAYYEEQEQPIYHQEFSQGSHMSVEPKKYKKIAKAEDYRHAERVAIHHDSHDEEDEVHLKDPTYPSHESNKGRRQPPPPLKLPRPANGFKYKLPAEYSTRRESHIEHGEQGTHDSFIQVNDDQIQAIESPDIDKPHHTTTYIQQLGEPHLELRGPPTPGYSQLLEDIPDGAIHGSMPFYPFPQTEIPPYGDISIGDGHTEVMEACSESQSPDSKESFTTKGVTYSYAKVSPEKRSRVSSIGSGSSSRGSDQLRSPDMMAGSPHYVHSDPSARADGSYVEYHPRYYSDLSFSPTLESPAASISLQPHPGANSHYTVNGNKVRREGGSPQSFSHPDDAQMVGYSTFPFCVSVFDHKFESFAPKGLNGKRPASEQDGNPSTKKNLKTAGDARLNQGKAVQDTVETSKKDFQGDQRDSIVKESSSEQKCVVMASTSKKNTDVDQSADESAVGFDERA